MMLAKALLRPRALVSAILVGSGGAVLLAGCADTGDVPGSFSAGLEVARAGQLRTVALLTYTPLTTDVSCSAFSAQAQPVPFRLDRGLTECTFMSLVLSDGSASYDCVGSLRNQADRATCMSATAPGWFTIELTGSIPSPIESDFTLTAKVIELNGSVTATSSVTTISPIPYLANIQISPGNPFTVDAVAYAFHVSPHSNDDPGNTGTLTITYSLAGSGAFNPSMQTLTLTDDRGHINYTAPLSSADPTGMGSFSLALTQPAVSDYFSNGSVLTIDALSPDGNNTFTATLAGPVPGGPCKKKCTFDGFVFVDGTACVSTEVCLSTDPNRVDSCSTNRNPDGNPKAFQPGETTAGKCTPFS